MKVTALVLLLALVGAYAQVAPTTVIYRKSIPASGTETVQVPGAGVAANSLYYVHLQCDGAASQNDYSILFNLGSAPSGASSISGVNSVFWGGNMYGIPFQSEHVAPIATGNTDIYYSVSNRLGSPITCTFSSFLTSDIAAQPQAIIEYNTTTPIMQYFTLNVPVANSIVTVRIDDSDDDLSTHMRVVMAQGARPTYADQVSSECDQYFGNGEEITECLFSADTAGSYTFGVFTTQAGPVAAPPREVSISFDVCGDNIELKSGQKVTIGVPANGNAYFITQDPPENTAMFLRVTSSKSVAVQAMIALDTFPTQLSRLDAPRVITEVDEADPQNVLAISIVQADVLQGSLAHIRIWNAEFETVQYTLELIFAAYGSVLPGDQTIVSLPKAFNGLYRTVLDGTDNVLLITLVHDSPLSLWIRQDIPPTIDTADADFIADISETKDGKVMTRAIWSPSNGASPEGVWYIRIIPDKNDTVFSFTMTVTAGHTSNVGDYSQIGGRLVRGGVDYFEVPVTSSNTYGLYVAVESKGALTQSLFWHSGYPTEQEHYDRVSSRSYQLTWSPDSNDDDHFINEHYIMPKDLQRDNWTFSVAPVPGTEIGFAYSLTSVLFEIFNIEKPDDVQTYPLSQYKMSVLTYTFSPSGQQLNDDLTLLISPADGLDVIASRDIIPFTFEKSSSLRTVVSVADNTLSLTLTSATPGTYYYRVIASTAAKDVQASIKVGKINRPQPSPPSGQAAPSGGQNAAPSDSSNNNGNQAPNNLFLILITVFLGLLVVILTVVVVMFVLKNKANSSAEMTSIGSGDAKYSLLNEENARV